MIECFHTTATNWVLFHACVSAMTSLSFVQVSASEIYFIIEHKGYKYQQTVVLIFCSGWGGDISIYISYCYNSIFALLKYLFSISYELSIKLISI
jgi:hypothetical protein